MARLLVEIDESLKRELKVRLVREGVTLKSWIARMAREYVVDESPRAVAAAAREVRVDRTGDERRPPAARAHDDYLD